MPKAYTPNDRLAKRAQFQGYRARSVFKLQELDEKFTLIKFNQRILDIGAAPGSWLQYVSEKIGKKGIAVGVDLKEIIPVSSNVFTKVVDITNTEEVLGFLNQLKIDKFDLVLSDIAPNTSGIPGVDHAKSVELSQMCVNAADIYLRAGGSLIMKVFDGVEMGDFLKPLRNKYGFVTVYKVRSSRDRSREVYVVCQRKKK